MTDAKDRAIDYAIEVIESYQMDLRGARGIVAYGPEPTDESQPTLADQGFCQGSIYTGAVAQIRKIAAGEIVP